MEQYIITGMSCAACAARVEKAVGSVSGVTSCAVSLLTNSMGVEGTASPQEIISAVERAGYGASVKSGEGTVPAEDTLAGKEILRLVFRLAASLVFLLMLMYVTMGHTMLGMPLPAFLDGSPAAVGTAELILSSAVMIINRRFFVSGFRSAIHLSPNMDTLVAMGSGVSFAWSIYILLSMVTAQASRAEELLPELYFGSAAMILTLITVGKLLEAVSKGRTTNALKSLIKLAPKTACVIREDTEKYIPADAVRKGDIFVVRPGENIPVDGIVIEGASAVNEASLTGESIPVDKSAGSTVSAATINQSGFLKCEAVRVGGDTTLSQIIRAVSNAAATKAPIAKTADKVSGVFVPAVIAIAALTAVIWLLVGQSVGYALARGISVLVISCPCALGLATPVAIMVGNGVGARNGILFRTAVSLEETGRTEIAVFDKTGTITEGKPTVTEIIAADGTDADELVRTAYSLEKMSIHPFAGAITEYAEERGFEAHEAADFETLPGRGLRAVIGGKVITGGSLAYVSTIAEIDGDMLYTAEKLAESGKTPLLFSADDVLLGMIAVADVIKPDSAKAVRELKDMGIYVVMLTGDNEKTAQAVGAQAGVDRVIAGVLPDGKEAVIRSLQKQGKTVMVGDGINDAPALTRADIGIAVGAGTDVAIDAADIVLMRSSLCDVSAAIRLSRATLRIIRQNLFWAFFYNVIGIPLAAGAFVSLFGWEIQPAFGAAAMSLSSFFVVTNALRLNLADIHSSAHDRRIKKVIPSDETDSGLIRIKINVSGMMCSHCEARVRSALEKLDFVETASPDHKSGKVEVMLCAPADVKRLKKAVTEAGYRFGGIEK